MQRYHADQANALESQRTAARLRQERRAKRIAAGREQEAFLKSVNEGQVVAGKAIRCGVEHR